MTDHWCDLRQVPDVLKGELDNEPRHRRTFELRAGMSYYVADHGNAAHRSSTQTGVKLFIIDYNHRVESTLLLSFAEQFA